MVPLVCRARPRRLAGARSHRTPAAANVELSTGKVPKVWWLQAEWSAFCRTCSETSAGRPALSSSSWPSSILKFSTYGNFRNTTREGRKEPMNKEEIDGTGRCERRVSGRQREADPVGMASRCATASHGHDLNRHQACTMTSRSVVAPDKSMDKNAAALPLGESHARQKLRHVQHHVRDDCRSGRITDCVRQCASKKPRLG